MPLKNHPPQVHQSAIACKVWQQLKKSKIAIAIIISLLLVTFSGREVYKIFKKTKAVASSTTIDLVESIESLRRENEFLTEQLVRHLSQDTIAPEKNTPEAQIGKLIALCQMKREEADNAASYVDGNICLARSYSKQANYSKAVKHFSQALEHIVASNSFSELYDVILQNKQEEIIKALQQAIFSPEHKYSSLDLLSRLNQDEFSQASKNTLKYSTAEEIKLLTDLISLDIPRVSMLAHYRLSYVFQYGRSSVDEASDNTDLFMALKHRQKAFDGYHKADKDDNKTNYNETIDVILIFDNNFVEHAATTIASALFNSDLDHFYRFHIIEPPMNVIADHAKQKLAKMNYIRDYEMKFYTFPDQILDGLDLKFPKHWPKLVMYRLFLADIFPNLNKAVYIDADIIVKDDLAKLNNIANFDSYLFAAALDQGALYQTKWRNTGRKLPSINAGILSMNLRNMRSYNVPDKVFYYLQNNTDFPYKWFDQDIINLHFIDKTKIISSKWNFVYRADAQPLNYYNNFSEHFIYHYYQGGKRGKPWLWGDVKDPKVAESVWKNNKESMPEMVRVYWQYRDITPWTTQPEHLSTKIHSN